MRVETPEIYGDLQERLVTAQFAPGARLKPATLQDVYGCSANTIRDVLLQLSKVGLVDFEIQRGFRARAATAERRHDVTSFRILLEQEGAVLSMRRGGVGWEAALSAAHHKLRHIETQLADSHDDPSDMVLWSEAEREFHDTLISACGSSLLRETYANVYLQFRQQMVTLTRDFGTSYFTAIINEHQAIVDAALERDETRCREAIFDHLKRNL